MAILPILTYPDPRLRTLAKPITDINADIRTLISDMFDTMYAAKGIGLAATQVDRHVQLIVMDLASKDEAPAPQVFINPVVTPLTDALSPYQEGCLSIPEVYDTIERPCRVNIQALNQDGETFSIDAEGLLAVCIQHEMDHLNGVLFVDYLSRLKQDRARDKVKKVLKARTRT